MSFTPVMPPVDNKYCCASRLYNSSVLVAKAALLINTLVSCKINLVAVYWCLGGFCDFATARPGLYHHC